MKPWSLGSLLQGLELSASAPDAWPSLPIRQISLDSRQCQPGSLFVALRGQSLDGTAFIADAIGHGAVAVLVDAKAPADLSHPPEVPILRCPQLRSALATVAARFYGDPAERLTVVGITGTNGKTTVAHLLQQVLPEADATYWTTAEVWSGLRRFRPSMTTPHAPDLHRFFADALASDHHSAVIEVSSHAIVLDRVKDVPFQVGVVTNISPDHLDFHGTFEHYIAAKRLFAERLPSEATLVLNEDDPIVRGFAETSRAHVIRVGFSPKADLRALDFQARADGVRAHLRMAPSLARRLGQDLPQSCELAWHLPGRHNVSNALQALAAILALGYDWRQAADQLRSAEAPVRRMEQVHIGPYHLINDVAMNAASYDTVLNTVADLSYPHIVVVNAIRGHRGPEINAQAAHILAHWNQHLHFAPLIVTLSDDALSRLPTDMRVSPEELTAFLEVAKAEHLTCQVYRELDEAIAAAIDRLAPDSALLLLGTFGMDDGPHLAANLLATRAGLSPPALLYHHIEP